MSVEMFQRLGLNFKQNLKIIFLKKGFKSCFTGKKIAFVWILWADAESIR